MILDLHRQGLSVAAIARETGKDAKTIRRYVVRGLEPPAYGPRPPQTCRFLSCSDPKLNLGTAVSQKRPQTV